MGDRERNKRPSILRIVVWSTLASILVVLLVLVMYLVTSRSSLESRVEALRAAGMPTTMDELNAFYTAVPDGENAALVYQQAFDAYVPPPRDQLRSIPIIGGADLPEPGQWMSPGFFATAEMFLAQNEESLLLLRDAAELTEVRYPMDFSVWPDVDTSHLTDIRNAVGLLRLASVVRAYDGDADGAAQALGDAFAAAGSLGAEPVLISHLAQIAIVGKSVNTAEHILSVSKLSDESLTSLRDSSRRALRGSDLSRAFVGERTYALRGFQQFSGIGSVLTAFDQTSYLNALDKVIETMGGDASDRLGTAEKGSSGSGLGRYIHGP